MFQAYFENLGFVIGHAFMVLIYVLTLIYTQIMERRERVALKRLKTRLVPSDLLKLDDALSGLPGPSEMATQLRTAIAEASTANSFRTQQVSERVDAKLSRYDAAIRFCINGFVVVGLMGTLFAFYRMWHEAAAAQASLTNETYLGNMARALSVSFVGLLLGLIGSFVFSVVTARRRGLMAEISEYLERFDSLVPRDSTTNRLLTRLLEPLGELITQIKTQNETVLGQLTATVDQRTEQLNKLIEDTTKQSQATMAEFKKEILAAVGSLKGSSETLSTSSKEVAATMKGVTTAMSDVSVSLERTKDIALLVEHMEDASTSMIKRISERLEKVTEASVKRLSLSAQQQKEFFEQQPKVLEKQFKTLTTRAAAAFKTVTGNVTTGLANLSQEFTKTSDATASKWMTLMTEGLNQHKKATTDLANEWQQLITETISTVNTSVLSSKDATAKLVGNLDALKGQIRELEQLIQNFKLNEEAPRILGEISATLTKLPTELASMNENIKQRPQAQMVAVSQPQGSIGFQYPLSYSPVDASKSQVRKNDEELLLQTIEDIRELFALAVARLELLETVSPAAETTT